MQNEFGKIVLVEEYYAKYKPLLKKFKHEFSLRAPFQQQVGNFKSKKGKNKNKAIQNYNDEAIENYEDLIEECRESEYDI